METCRLRACTGRHKLRGQAWDPSAIRSAESPVIDVEAHPTLEPKNAVRSVQEFLHSHRIDDVSVDCSAIPLRG